MFHMNTLVLRLAVLTLLVPASLAQQSYVERMDASFARRSPRAGEQLPDAAGYTADGKPFSLRETRGKLTVLVTGCIT